MSKRTTRRSISVRGLTYQRLVDHCEDMDCSVSGWVEIAIGQMLDVAGVPRQTILRPRIRNGRGSNTLMGIEDGEEDLSGIRML